MPNISVCLGVEKEAGSGIQRCRNVGFREKRSKTGVQAMQFTSTAAILKPHQENTNIGRCISVT